MQSLLEYQKLSTDERNKEMVHLNRGHKLLLGFACCCPHDDFFLYHGSTVRTFMGHMMRARVTRKVCSHE